MKSHRSDHPLSETMAELFKRHDALPREIERCRLEARRLQEEVAGLKRDLAKETKKALAKLAGQGDAHYREKAAKADVADLEYELDLRKAVKASAWAAWKERVEQYDSLKALANAYNRELRELGG